MVSSIECARAPCENEDSSFACQLINPIYDTAYLIKYQPFSPTKHARGNDPECQCHMKIDGIYYSTITEVGYVNGETHRCGEHSYSCWDRHYRRQFRRRGGFAFFDLPPEIRMTILELLLVKEKVALTPNTHQRVEEMALRFPQWQHEPPEWGLLEAVSRQMQAEASAIFYSAKNTFFLPAQRGLHYHHENIEYFFPYDIKRIDCEFSMEDFTFSHAVTYEAVKKMHPFNAQQVAFANWSRDEIQRAIHQALCDEIHRYWNRAKHACLCSWALDLWRIDLTNCRCPAGCCRLAPTFAYDLLRETQHDEQHKRFEFRGLSVEERDKLQVMLEENGVTPAYEVFFIDQAGCTCTVSSGAQDPL